MKKVLLNILILILRGIYVPIKLFKIRKKITYISRQSNSESLDFKLIREEMERHHPEFKNIVLTKKIESGVLNKICYFGEILKQMYHIATSKVVIVDTYCITVSVLKHKKTTKIIQIWHALRSNKKIWNSSIRQTIWAYI